MRIPASTLLLALAVPLFGGCTLHFGTNPATFAPALTPDGANAVLEVRTASVTGELLAADDSGLLVVVLGRLSRVPHALIDRASFPDFGYSFRTQGQTPEPATLARVRLIARYPTGIPAAALPKLLAQRGQDAIEVLK